MCADRSFQKTDIEFKFRRFDFPPAQDALIIGKRAPIGKHATKKMLDAIAPEQFDCIEVEDEVVEAVFVKRSLLHALPAERLAMMLLGDIKHFMTREDIYKVTVTVQFAFKHDNLS